LDLTLPAINDADLETLIESRVNALVRQHLSPAAGDQDGTVGGGGGGVRGRIAVEFYEKKRRRSGMWFGGLAGKGEEEVCWEMWTLDVTIATPRTESGTFLGNDILRVVVPRERCLCLGKCISTLIIADMLSNRTSQGPQGYGEYASESGIEDSDRCQSGQRSYPTNHDQ
jgi:hypothetical protein